jgi:hypothetical protein
MSEANKPITGAPAPLFSTLALLQQQFPQRAALDCKELALAIGCNWKHIANQAAAGNYPIRSQKIGGLRVFPLVAIAEYLDGGRRLRRGAPTKAERIAAHRKHTGGPA